MNNKFIITIARQFGSGGHEIGKALAESLGIPFYDKELISLAAKDSGMDAEVFENVDERATNSLLYSLSMGLYSFGSSFSAMGDLPVNDRLYILQHKIIKKLAEEGPCVIVGRCADYALEDYDNCVNIFISAPLKVRCDRIMKRREILYNDALSAIKKTDKQRESYHNFYASSKWGNVNSYDLCINSHILGIDGTVDLLVDFVNEKEKNS